MCSRPDRIGRDGPGAGHGEMREHNLRIELPFNLFKPIFYGWPLTGKITFPKRSDSDLTILDSRKEIVRARRGFCGPISGSAKDGPPDF